MEMSRFEKLFVNREGKGRRNVTKVRQRLDCLDAGSIHDVLEIGCGIGTVSGYVAEIYGMRVVGTDFDPEQIDKARKAHSENDRLQFQVEDVADLSFQKNAFDLVISHNVFHHIPAWKVAVSEVSRVLRPHGHLMWLDIVFAKPIRRLLGAIEREGSFFSLDEVRETFAEVGLQNRFHQRVPLLFFTQHHFVFERI